MGKQTLYNDLTITGNAIVNGITFGTGAGNIATNTAAGSNALLSNTAGAANTAIGWSSLRDNIGGNYNTALGWGSLLTNTNGSYNIANGAYSLSSNSSGAENTAIGYACLLSNVAGNYNTASGSSALRLNTSGNFNTATGINCLYTNSLGSSNTASGYRALFASNTSSNNSAFGVEALSSNTFSNTSGFGSNAQVTGDNQVQLGDSATTTYVYNTVQSRSDARDKADIVDTALGLDFISLLRPVDYKWDMREDYRTEMPPVVLKPMDLGEDATEEDEAKYDEELAAFEAYVVAKDEWLEASKLANITHDGSKKRSRYHHGLIAQEVKEVLEQQEIDFGGFQDHSIKGGDDVLSIGYIELIAPMIKAIQELKARIEQLESEQASS
jgi:hypothetical protein